MSLPIFIIYFITLGCNNYVQEPVKHPEGYNSKLSDLIIRHGECTDCQDIVVDSGEVFVPENIKTNFRGKKLLGGYTSKLNTHDMRLENDSIFNELFGTTPNQQFENRYRVQGEVIGLKDSCELIFRIYRYEKL